MECISIRTTARHRGRITSAPTRNAGIAVALGLILALAASPAHAQYTQQGAKLVGAGAVGGAAQGSSAALSADGNTLLVGGLADDDYAGAAWVFARDGDTWSQQGPKLVGTHAAGSAFQGSAVALSGDGSTALIGGPGDMFPAGAVWVFTRDGRAWHQQGEKMTGTGAVGSAYQGDAVATSADGSTAIVGGYVDRGLFGAAWVFTRGGDVWTQQGQKLVASDGSGSPLQGISVAISADGNTAVVGGAGDAGGIGAAWIYQRIAGTWTQQGAKLVGTGALGTAMQGISVAISGDGNTAIVGGSYDDHSAGAAWVYTRSGGVWTQQGPKLVGTGAAGGAFQGIAVALSADGGTAVLGGSFDGDRVGAAWVFKRRAGVWHQQGAKLVGTGSIHASYQGSSVAVSADGATLVVGGFHDDGGAGATWAYFRPDRNLPPDCSLAVAEPARLWPPDQRLVPVSIAGVTDPDGDPVTLRVTRVTQDEPLGSAAGAAVLASWSARPAGGAVFGGRVAAPGGGADPGACADAVIDAQGAASVRAERAGDGNGRVYTLWFTASDGVGGTCEGSVRVCVPHDLGHAGCVDDGQRFDSLGPCPDGHGAGVGIAGLDAFGETAVKEHAGPGGARVLEYALSAPSDVTIGLYDVGGRRIATLRDERQEAGAHAVAWDGVNGGTRAAAGVYFLRIQASGRQVVRRVVLVR